MVRSVCMNIRYPDRFGLWSDHHTVYYGCQVETLSDKLYDQGHSSSSGVPACDKGSYTARTCTATRRVGICRRRAPCGV